MEQPTPSPASAARPLSAVAAAAPRPIKAVATRVAECKEIREHLQRVGALTQPRVREDLKVAMNAFVRDGTPHTCTVRLGDAGTRARVVLAALPRHQSGVTLQPL